MPVGIYIRVSTEEQAREGFSISAQREKLKAYCESRNWDDYKFYVDEGLSAKDTNRPQLRTMLSHIEQGLITTVLVYKLDRLTRSVMDLYKLIDIFDKYNCSFKSHTEEYDTSTAMGRMFITIVAVLAQWERENLGERVRMGQIEKARQGKYSAKAPFGFNKDKDDVLVINEEESKVVLDMVKRIEEGYSIRRLARHLESYTKPIRAHKWHIATILSILSNPALYGAIYWAGEIIEGAHLGIITKEEFDKLQQLISSRQNFKKRKVSSIHVFQMTLVCPTCGSRFTCERSAYTRKTDKVTIEHNRYRCQPCALNGRKSMSVSEINTENAFIDYINGLQFNNIPEQKNSEEVNEIEIIKKQQASIEKQREKYHKAWARDLMTDNEFTKLMGETKEESNKLKEKLEYLKEDDEEVTNYTEIKEVVKDIKDNWYALTQEEKKQFVNMFIKNIYVDKIGRNVIVKDVDFY
ncbi:recombinase family protein [Bacillus paranthracis]|uniref:recombinase family protein n=1 Tax=Bacillus paranthracis TaxID=2026186 RepID=UPI0020B8120A|nr:recombinase family protein [Bacillus paranthracis]